MSLIINTGTGGGVGFRYNLPVQLLNASATTGWGTAVRVEQFSNVILELIGAGTSVGDVKVYASYQDEEPNWTASVTASNRFYPVATLNLNDQNRNNGSTGIVFSANGNRHLILGLNGAKWVNVLWTRTGGNMSAWIAPYNNQ